MRYPPALLAQLAAALSTVDTPERRARYKAGSFPRSHLTKFVNIRYRWDILREIPGYYDKFVRPAYDDGMNDDHVDTALRNCIPTL